MTQKLAWRQCRVCQEWRPLSAFPSKRRLCVTCRNQLSKAWRQVRYRGGVVRGTLPMEVWRAYSGLCGICGCPVPRWNPDGPSPVPPDGLTLDHIDPGGRHEPANLQPAHAGCNDRKGRGTGADLWQRSVPRPTDEAGWRRLARAADMGG